MSGYSIVMFSTTIAVFSAIFNYLSMKNVLILVIIN